MAILANRVKVKNNLIELGKFTLFSARKTFILLLIALSCYLLYFSSPKYIASSLLETTGRILSAGQLIYKESINFFSWTHNRVAHFRTLEDENLMLRIKIAELEKEKQINADLRSENNSLRKILHIPKEVKHRFVTAKVAGISSTPFSNTAIIEAGELQNIKVNDIVRGPKGLVGRVSEVSSNYATIMLIQDHNSRIPVITGNTKTKGILAKQGEHLKLIYLEKGHKIENGEMIYTSGDGKIYPKGIAVASVKKISEEEALVKEAEDLSRTDFVVVENIEH